MAVAAPTFAAWWLDRRLDRAGPSMISQQIVVPRRIGAEAIGRLLHERGAIDDARLFRVAAWLARDRGPLRAGEYHFPPHLSLRGAVAVLQEGRPVVRRLTVPEGATAARTTAILALAEGLEGDPPVGLREGDVLPETYHYSWGDSRLGMAQRMRRAMDELVEKLWAERAPDVPLASPAQAVILASIVERETALAEERPRIARVFLNRLARGMRLQSDPTVIYALTGGPDLGRPLTRADLRTASPYNTYATDGLPPGPIANPGRASLAAVLRPAAGDELYFVADGAGGHVFARTLDEHNRNVARWRRWLREQGNAADQD
jgi:UPF0755 protein